jgi:protein-S-isoprenylcysteine O-methyltransferase Ste14
LDISPNDLNQFAWLVWLSSWLLAAKWSSPTERRPDFRLEATYRLLTAAGAILLFGLHQRWPSTEVALWHLGPKAAWTLVATAVCGFVFAWWARIELGRLWSSGVTRKTDHRIVTTGPYKLVRHPIYSGIIFAVLATAVMRGTAAGLFGAALIVLGLFVKARVEEGFLRSELGEQLYVAYARRVPMLVPFVL